MILVADSGSTKTDWILTDGDKIHIRFNTIGYNPYFINSDGIYDSVCLKLIPDIDVEKIERIFFYGAGCSTPEKCTIVYKALSRCFPNAEISVRHDMLGAARALLGHSRGFAAIIGTGSNTCIYDGTRIEKNTDSLGYLLGDEGSGSYIGKKIVANFMRDYLPVDLREKFKLKYQYTNEEIFDTIYNKPYPNRFLSGFCRFADENKEHEFIQKIVRESFNDFFKNLVSRYPGYQSFSFNCVGSVAVIFSEILAEVAKSYSMKVGKMISSPIEELTNYHLDLITSASTVQRVLVK